jgi:iron-sulfur cluster repair protein YtfE (RIC family)
MATAIATRTVTVNAAFLQEIKEVNHDLWRLLDDVRRMCLNPTSVHTSPRRFIGLVDQLRDQLAMHFALEEAFGYFDDPIDVAPRLCEQAERLRAEHADLYMRIVELGDVAERLVEPIRRDGLVLQVVHDFHDFDKALQHHETLENELILEEYDDDIGVGD